MPEEERDAVVDAVVRRVDEVYGPDAPGEEAMFDIAEPPRQRDGYTEQIVRTYSRPPRRDAPGSGRRAAGGDGA